MNIQNKVSGASREAARLNRESELNPPDFAPGMEETDSFGFGGESASFDNTDQFGGTTGGFGDAGFGGTDFGGGGFGTDTSFGGADNGFGGGFGGGFDNGFGGGFDNGFGGMPGMPQQQTAEKPIEDKIFDGIAAGAKGSVNIVKACVNAKKTFGVEKVMAMGKQSMLIGGIGAVLGIILWLTLSGIGKPTVGISLFIGGAFALGTGIMLFMTAYDKFQKNGGQSALSEQQSAEFTDMPENNDFSAGFDNNDFGGFEESVASDTFDFDDNLSTPTSSIEEAESTSFEDFDFGDDSSSFEDTAPVLTKEDILATLNVDSGMVTRQYLFERVIQILEKKTPDYDKVTVIDEASDDFNNWAAVIEECSSAIRTNDNNKLPQLLEAKEKMFYYNLTIKRERWCKTDALVNEIVNYVGYDEKTGKMEEGVYGHGHEAANKGYITIMKGETAMITIRDIMEKNKDFFLDTKNYIPVALGVDTDGEAVLVDLKNINSMLVTGMPRSGKSWAVKSILAQMMFFCKPSELQFYLMDPKGGISDFRTVKTPHIKKFVSTDEGIVKELRYIVKDFAMKRKKLFGDANCVNIWDYKEKFPNVEMPLIYVVIDEVVTLAERMDKETKAEFQGLLTELVSQLPALGIRIFMIPHVVKDQIIKKTTTDLIPCRISVRGDAAHIEATLGDKQFPYKLSHVGDMAVRLNNDPTKMVHSSILASTNPGTDNVYDFLNAMWCKIEPDMANNTEETAEDYDADTAFNVMSAEKKPGGNAPKKATKTSSVTKEKKGNSMNIMSPNTLVLGDTDDDDTNDSIDIW